MAISASRYLDRDNICVLMPPEFHKRIGENFFVDQTERKLIEPFVNAGLITLVEHAPAGIADDHSRLWYEISDYGGQLLTECLTDPNNYPKTYQVGFKIGTRHVADIALMGRPRRLKCFSVTSAYVTYRLQIEAPWFEFDRFHTNFSALGFDPVKNKGSAAVPFTKVGRVWSQQEDLLSPHSTFTCDTLN